MVTATRDALRDTLRKTRIRQKLNDQIKIYANSGFDPITVYDIGARWGISPPYDLLAHTDILNSVGFEPDEEEAIRLEKSKSFSKVISCALGSRCETRTLGIAKDPGSSSLFEPDPLEIQRHTDWDGFKVQRKINLDVVPLDQVVAHNDLRSPDIMKVDVEGFERLIFEGASNCLNDLIGVTFESRLFQFYKNETLLPEMLNFFTSKGFVLLKLEPVGSFYGSEVMFDVSMQKHPSSYVSDRQHGIGMIFALLHGKPEFANRIQMLRQSK